MNIGLALQVMALAMLLVPSVWLTVPWVMAAQALSGIAKDLNKMSAKSSIKLLVPGEAQGQLYRWVALLTGSKNALKGMGQLQATGPAGRGIGVGGRQAPVTRPKPPFQPPAPSPSYPRFGANQRSASASGIPLRRA